MGNYGGDSKISSGCYYTLAVPHDQPLRGEVTVISIPVGLKNSARCTGRRACGDYREAVQKYGWSELKLRDLLAITHPDQVALFTSPCKTAPPKRTHRKTAPGTPKGDDAQTPPPAAPSPKRATRKTGADAQTPPPAAPSPKRTTRKTGNDAQTPPPAAASKRASTSGSSSHKKRNKKRGKTAALNQAEAAFKAEDFRKLWDLYQEQHDFYEAEKTELLNKFTKEDKRVQKMEKAMKNMVTKKDLNGAVASAKGEAKTKIKVMERAHAKEVEGLWEKINVAKSSVVSAPPPPSGDIVNLEMLKGMTTCMVDVIKATKQS